MEVMWNQIVGTHPATTRSYFDKFALNLWVGWAREKKKTANRLLSGVRRNRGESTQQSTSKVSSNPAQLHLTPSAIVGKPLPSPLPSTPRKRRRLQSPLSDSGGSPVTVEDTAKMDSPSTSFFTLRKRRCLQQPLPDSGGAVDEYLLHQLAGNIQEGMLTREGVLRTMDSLAERPGEPANAEEYPTEIEEDELRTREEHDLAEEKYSSCMIS